MGIARDDSAWSLGIDTSAYTTSVAAVGAAGLRHQERQLLPVDEGKRGLRPSDALYLHLRNLPSLVERLCAQVPIDGLAQVAVSIAPRPVASSYLPPFLAGEAIARAIGASRGVPVLRTSHQEGHIRAGMAGSGLDPDGPFMALHVSGGTTELVKVEGHSPRLTITTVGASDDLYGGQFIDRIGVLLGSAFPAGPQMDAWAEATDVIANIPVSRARFHDHQWWISFSGPESAAERALAQGAERYSVARGVMESIAVSLAHLVTTQTHMAGGNLLIVGGVAANTHLRRRMQEILAASWRIWFASPEWSRDNAVGVAYLGWDAYQDQPISTGRI